MYTTPRTLNEPAPDWLRSTGGETMSTTPSMARAAWTTRRGYGRADYGIPKKTKKIIFPYHYVRAVRSYRKTNEVARNTANMHSMIAQFTCFGSRCFRVSHLQQLTQTPRRSCRPPHGVPRRLRWPRWRACAPRLRAAQAAVAGAGPE